MKFYKNKVLNFFNISTKKMVKYTFFTKTPLITTIASIKTSAINVMTINVVQAVTTWQVAI